MPNASSPWFWRELLGPNEQNSHILFARWNEERWQRLGKKCERGAELSVGVGRIVWVTETCDLDCADDEQTRLIALIAS